MNTFVPQHKQAIWRLQTWEVMVKMARASADEHFAVLVQDGTAGRLLAGWARCRSPSGCRVGGRCVEGVKIQRWVAGWGSGVYNEGMLRGVWGRIGGW
jgi:hypothetical protein